MKVIGLTGGSGSGKSTISMLLKEMTKTYIIDADKIGHKIILKGQEAYYLIIRSFDRTILKEDGEINRRKLGEIVFSNKLFLNILNQITHPKIKEEIIKEINQVKKTPDFYDYIIIDAALLIESGLYELTDEIWAVYADVETRIQRIMLRDGLNRNDAKTRIHSQMPWKEMKKYADRIIDNGKDRELTKKQLRNIIER
ncbi:MAG: dephospho-CoA kinase [Epulopiscium sp.]|nr:dephospho-CoA kinase [Candidatus Epulonipiscium sp.]